MPAAFILRGVGHHLVPGLGHGEPELVVKILAIPDDRGADFGRHEIFLAVERRERNARGLSDLSHPNFLIIPR